MIKFLILVAFISLTGCAAKPTVDLKAEVLRAQDTLNQNDAPIDSSLTKPCNDPTVVEKTRTLPQPTARRLWNLDRHNLRECKARHAALAKEKTSKE